MLKQQIENILTTELQPTFLQLIDESYKHIGHPGAAAGGKHFALTISAEKLNGLNKIAAHRIIYKLLQEFIPEQIHALNITIK